MNDKWSGNSFLLTSSSYLANHSGLAQVLFCTTYLLTICLWIVHRQVANLALTQQWLILLPVYLYIGPSPYRMGYQGETQYYLVFHKSLKHGARTWCSSETWVVDANMAQVFTKYLNSQVFIKIQHENKFHVELLCLSKNKLTHEILVEYEALMYQVLVEHEAFLPSQVANIVCR